MKPIEQPQTTDTRPDRAPSAWRPEVLRGATEAGATADFDLAEIWHWFHARLEWLGDLTPDEARLQALLHWREKSITIAVQAARLEANRFPEADDGRRAYLEYLAADCLARFALGRDSLPDLEPHPA